MARIAFILLCHKDPDAIIAQARQLTAAGDYISIHFDARSGVADFDRIEQALGDSPNIALVHNRVRCGWGEWSLVKATIAAIELALDKFPRATHFYMVSGDCMAIKPAQYTHALLDRDDADFIESFDFFKSDWIKTGFKEERLIYRHLFNERLRKRLFYYSFDLQKKLGLTRKIPADLQIMIGSQWWCLRRPTIEAVMDFIKQRPDIRRFFRTTWMPDETFFQTLVRHLIPDTEIRCRTLTFLMFTDYGMPVTFYNDHYDLLLGQDYLFARKISPEAIDLKRRLGELYASESAEITISGEGRSLYEFLSKRGRVGQRFVPRFWESKGSLGRDRELLIVICKKWHVAKRLVERIRKMTNLVTLEYVFDEDTAHLPDLGGIENSMVKRARHRRALTLMLYEYFQTDQMVICLDPANLDLVQDFHSDRSKTRMLEIDCRLSDTYLIGHARRVGLAGEGVPDDSLAPLLPTIRNQVMAEIDQLRDANFPEYYRVCESATNEENAVPLSQFLQIPPDRAHEIASVEHLFSD